MVPALAFFGWSYHSLGPNFRGGVGLFERHELVTSGAYRVMRHPIYVAFVLMMALVCVVSANWVMTAASCVRAGAEILGAYADSSGLRATIAVGGLGQAVGILLFVVNMWTRVRMPAGAPQRQEQR